MNHAATQSSPININPNALLSTHSVRQEFDSRPDRLKNLLYILSSLDIRQNLSNRWVAIEWNEQDDQLRFVIKLSDTSFATETVKNIWDFYRILRQYRHIFFDCDTVTYQNKTYKKHAREFVDDTSTKTMVQIPWLQDAQRNNIHPDAFLMWKFIETYWLPELEEQGIQNEYEAIKWYRNERKDAINKLLSKDVLSPRIVRSYGETPFYEKISDNPELKKKALMLAALLWKNKNFVNYANNSLSENNDLLRVFCNILDEVSLHSLENLAALLQNPHFTRYLVWPYVFDAWTINNIAELIRTTWVSELHRLSEIHNFNNFFRVIGHHGVAFYIICNMDAFKNFDFFRFQAYQEMTDEQVTFFTSFIRDVQPVCLPTVLEHFPEYAHLSKELYAFSDSFNMSKTNFPLRFFYFVDSVLLRRNIFKWFDDGGDLNEKLYLIAYDREKVAAIINKGKNPSRKSFLRYDSL